MTDTRLSLLAQWLTGLPARHRLEPKSLRKASDDASFRRYFRIDTAGPEQPTLIVMDAPPPQEDCRPFVQAARVFGQAGVSVPGVLEADLDHGFLLLTDLGTTTYLQVLDAERAAPLYTAATGALVRLQLASRPGVFPDYDRALLERELMLFPDWYVTRHFKVTLTERERSWLRDAFELLLANNLAQPNVFVHRDYHSRNLMLLPGAANPGILDFQDAVYGPITYDLVSLLRDAYIRWDEQLVLDWTIRYWQRARAAGLPVNADFAVFYRDFEWMGLQRHLKILGIFARLNYRDGKDRYLADLPLVLDYVVKTARRYGALDPLMRVIDRVHGRADQTGYTF
jgi:N-acetylmuramate 1-kinase